MVTNTIVPIPPYTPDYLPVPQVTPFTFRDGASYLERLEDLIKYIDRIVLPTINEQMNDLGDEFVEEINALIQLVNAAVETIINDSIEVQDPVVAGIFSNPASATRVVTDPLYGDHGVKGYFSNDSSETRSVTDLLYGAKSVVDALQTAVNNLPNVYVAKNTLVYNVKDYGAVGDGVADDTPKIAAAIAAAVDGSKILFPAGTYAVSTIDNAGKSLAFDAKGASFIKDVEAPTVSLSGGFDDIVNVTSYTSGTITEHDGSTASIVITTPTNMPWKRGDIVKLISDDIIPDSRDEGKPGVLLQMRLGQFFMVHSVSGLTVNLAGQAIDTFTTNIKVARIKETRVSWDGGTFDVTDSHINNGRKSRTIDVRNLANCSVDNVTIKRTTSVGIAFSGCYGPTTKNTDIRWGLNDLTDSPAGNAGLGYAIACFSTQGYRGTNLYAHSVRHGYTDGTAFIAAGDTSFSSHGRPMDNILTNSIVDSATGTAYDTHTSGCHTIFSDSIAINCSGGVAFRGRENSAFNMKLVKISGAALRVFTEDNGGTYGHTFDGITINEAKYVFEASVNRDSGTPDYGVKESRPNFISNINARSIIEKGLKIHNAVVYANNINALFYSNDTNPYSLNYFENSEVFANELDMNTGGLTATGNLAIVQFDLATVSRVQLDGFTVRGDLSKFTKIFHNGTDAVIRCKRLMLDTMPASSIVDATTVGGWVDYELISGNGSSSAYITVSDSEATDSTALNKLVRNRLPVIHAAVSISAAKTLANLPSPSKRGATLIIRNLSNYVLTVNNSGNFASYDGTNRAIPAGKSMMCVADTSIWRELSFV